MPVMLAMIFLNEEKQRIVCIDMCVKFILNMMMVDDDVTFAGMRLQRDWLRDPAV